MSHLDQSTPLGRRPQVTVSGSFHRHLTQIELDVGTFHAAGCDVLSPAEPRPVDAFGEFVFVASDRVRTMRVVQRRHFEAIRRSDLLWLVCPDGYVGPSAAMEVGLAAGIGVPVFAETAPGDQTLRLHVDLAASPGDAVRQLTASGPVTDSLSVVFEPELAVEFAHRHLDRIESLLTHGDLTHRADDARLSWSATHIRDSLSGLLQDRSDVSPPPQRRRPTGRRSR